MSARLERILAELKNRTDEELEEAERKIKEKEEAMMKKRSFLQY